MSKAMVAMLAGTILLAGCGGDTKAPVDKQLQSELTGINAGLSQKLNPLFAALKKRATGAQISASVRAQTKTFAAAQRAAVKKLQRLNPPADVRSDVARWAQGLRKEAAVLTRTIGKKSLTGQKLVEAILANAPPAVADLQKKGYLPPG